MIHNIYQIIKAIWWLLFDSELSNLEDSVLDYLVYNGYEKLEFDFGENAFRDGDYFQGKQQARKLFNDLLIELVKKNKNVEEFYSLTILMNWR